MIDIVQAEHPVAGILETKLDWVTGTRKESLGTILFVMRLSMESSVPSRTPARFNRHLTVPN